MGASNMTNADSPTRYLTTAEAAEYLRYSRADVFLALDRRSAGETVTVRFMRDREEQEVTVRLQ